MKNIIIISVLLLSTHIYAQSNNIAGAYLSKNKDLNNLYLITNNYLSVISYQDDKYLGTYGGPIVNNGKELSLKLEYHYKYPDSVGLQKQIPIQFRNTQNLSIDGLKVIKTNNKKQDLDGLWRITGRKSADKMNTIPKGDRKTIKILVDGYFQWIAINPAEKGFYGTGGGEYSFDKGKYTEDILFFSRDNSRVGNTLNFEGAIKEKQWHHSGKSSKGDPIYEIWSLE